MQAYPGGGCWHPICYEKGRGSRCGLMMCKQPIGEEIASSFGHAVLRAVNPLGNWQPGGIIGSPGGEGANP